MSDQPGPKGLSHAAVLDWLTRFAATVRSVEPELTALDQKAGDGDFGANLVTGMDGVRRALEALVASTGNGRRGPDVPLDAAARVFLDDVGGTSGPLFGLLFQELADALGMAADPPGTAALALGTAAGAAAIQRVGEAEVGDKTMVDALVPAARALASCAPTADPAHALHVAAVAAHRGARATTDLRARRGRASYTGDHARGVPDPGALAVALLFASAHAELTSLSRLPVS
ncbi:dihydroxyacetone kinase subunit DhaL [Streptomyces sp. NPDC044780]|uniref:Dihydroxyacetone kinase subunit DhaL n=1 Tax=Streptomyces luomodiensis TaxID=3026192 RepID=A0ABY9V6Q4_9ACTN|nr:MULTISPECIES: dihydroxyacetone kinase subunit DhaL [unclassified Streptomyces]WAP59941.1 dihydroxyacetone kinase subunit DhaL [Streptomyces sp. S465]WNF00573.1 dihydroxyacetone kinase subunit DhaL [Streptomyces sp. SCA4-21]